MSEEVVKTEVVKKEKVKKEPKEPRLRKGITADQWKQRLQELTVEKVPDGWIGMSEIVKEAQKAEIKVSRICTAMGGDRGLGEFWDDVFKIVYVGGRKYGSAEILTKGFALLMDPEFHKVTRKGRPQKEKIEGVGNGGKKISVKPAPGLKRSDVWKA